MALATKYRYTLDPGPKKFRCPACGKKRFVRYLDDKTGQHLPDDIGRCDREISCGYHKPPREADGIELSNALYSAPQPPKPLKPSTLPFQYVERSQGKYESNSFIQWLATLPGWDPQRAEAAGKLYKVGTGSNDVKGWAIFWQIDEEGKVRSGKLMKYSNGHRVKEGYSQDWIHSKLKRSSHLQEFELVQCFYGLHLVDQEPVAIVESEKTAIIASQYLPQFTWIASGQLHGINEYKMKPLKGKRVVLFPDIGAYSLWNEKAEELGMNISVSSLLEENAPKQHKGYDLADYLIQFDIKEFTAPYGFNPYTGETFDERGYPANWDEIENTGKSSFKSGIRHNKAYNSLYYNSL